MLFEEWIRKFEYRLNDTDDQIIEYIRNHKAEVITQSIQVLAITVFTVPNTIVRLAKKLGYDGFSHLKVQLKEEMTTERMIESSLYLYLKKTYELIDDQKLKQISKLFHKANQILCYRIGDTVPLCESMVKWFKNMGAQTIFHLHRHEVVEEVSTTFKQGDIIFLISISGESQQVLEVAELAREKKLMIISLTHFSENTLAKLAAINLFCYTPKRRWVFMIWKQKHH